MKNDIQIGDVWKYNDDATTTQKVIAIGEKCVLVINDRYEEKSMSIDWAIDRYTLIERNGKPVCKFKAGDVVIRETLEILTMLNDDCTRWYTHDTDMVSTGRIDVNKFTRLYTAEELDNPDNYVIHEVADNKPQIEGFELVEIEGFDSLCLTIPSGNGISDIALSMVSEMPNFAGFVYEEEPTLMFADSMQYKGKDNCLTDCYENGDKVCRSKWVALKKEK